MIDSQQWEGGMMIEWAGNALGSLQVVCPMMRRSSSATVVVVVVAINQNPNWNLKI